MPAAIKRPPMDLGSYNQGYTESEFLEKFKCATDPPARGGLIMALSRNIQLWVVAQSG